MLRALFVAVSLCSTLASAQAVLLDRVVASVDGRPILRSQVRERMKPALSRATTEEDRKRLAQGVLEELIDEALVAQDADAMRLEVTPEEVSRAVADVATANGLTMEALERELAKQGYTMAGYRRAVRSQLLSLRWLLGRATTPRPEGKEAFTQWVDSTRRLLVQELRARATIEVLP